MIPPLDFLTKVMQFDALEAKEMLAAAQADAQKKAEEDAALAEEHGLVPQIEGFAEPTPPPVAGQAPGDVPEDDGWGMNKPPATNVFTTELDDDPDYDPAHNVFCATGAGGGVDPGCKVGTTAFHATSAEFDKFGKSADIGYHFGNEGQARFRQGDNKGRLIEAEFHLENPLRTPDHVWDTPTTARSYLTQHGLSTPDLDVTESRWRALSTSAPERIKVLEDQDIALKEFRRQRSVIRDEVEAAKKDAMRATREALVRAGHDGIVYANQVEGAGDSFIVFDADRIKIKKSTTLNQFCPTGEGGGIDPKCGEGGGAAAPHGDTAPDPKHLEKQNEKSKLHANVSTKTDAGGNTWVVKGRAGKGAAVANEATASKLAKIAGVDVPPVHPQKHNGQDVAVIPHREGTPLSAMSPADRRAAVAKVPKADLDRNALFDYAIGNGDPNTGNYLITKGGKMVAIDKEQSLTTGTGKGNKSDYHPPGFLESAVQQGKAPVHYEFDRRNMTDMASKAHQMADDLEKQGKKKEAEGVRRRAEVMTRVAAGANPPTAGELDRVGREYDKSNPAAKGIGGFLRGLVGNAADADAWNVFCATGEGGGVDPSCGADAHEETEVHSHSTGEVFWRGPRHEGEKMLADAEREEGPNPDLKIRKAQKSRAQADAEDAAARAADDHARTSRRAEADRIKVPEDRARSLLREVGGPDQSHSFFQRVSMEGRKFPMFMGSGWSDTIKSAPTDAQVVSIPTAGLKSVFYNKGETEWRVGDYKGVTVNTCLPRPNR
jgi:hypothetical protein